MSIFLLLPIGVFFFLIYYRLKKELPPTRRQMVGTLVGLALVANLSVQSTGGLASPIFLVYFGVIFVASVLGDVRLAIATFA
ncbi:hypothetical protein E3J38_06210, partial [candidate division TA06 bacterium]